MADFKDGYIYRLFPADVWEGIAAGQTVPFGAHDEADGFFHLSAPGQVLETARLHYCQFDRVIAAGMPESAPGDALKWEASRGGQLFPHIYGEVQRDWFDHQIALIQKDGSFTMEVTAR